MISNNDPLNLIISGVGGQGNILISRLLGRAFFKKGYHVTIGETFGAAQRGGAVFSSLRISKNKQYGPLVPEGQGHVIIGLEPLETLRTLGSFGNENVETVTNFHPIYPVGVLAKRLEYPPLDKLKDGIKQLSGAAWFIEATPKALELGAPIVANIIMLGALLGANLIPLSKPEVEDEIKSTFPETKTALNIQALNLGASMAANGN